MWGWDWDHQTYSNREGYGSLGLLTQTSCTIFWTNISRNDHRFAWRLISPKTSLLMIPVKEWWNFDHLQHSKLVLLVNLSETCGQKWVKHPHDWHICIDIHIIYNNSTNENNNTNPYYNNNNNNNWYIIIIRQPLMIKIIRQPLMISCSTRTFHKAPGNSCPWPTPSLRTVFRKGGNSEPFLSTYWSEWLGDSGVHRLTSPPATNLLNNVATMFMVNGTHTSFPISLVTLGIL